MRPVEEKKLTFSKIYSLIPMIQPDLIHCHDWMTGLILAAARGLGIPCPFTVYDVRTKQTRLSYIEDMGINAAFFWENLFYDRMPLCYEETRETNPVDLLLSGIHAADYVNAASLGVVSEVSICQNGNDKTVLRQLLRTKCQRGCVSCKYKDTPATREYIDIYNAILN